MTDGTRDDETVYSFHVDEQQLVDPASGYVPRTIKAMATDLLHWAEQDAQRAARPVPQKRKKE